MRSLIIGSFILAIFTNTCKATGSSDNATPPSANSPSAPPSPTDVKSSEPLGTPDINAQEFKPMIVSSQFEINREFSATLVCANGKLGVVCWKVTFNVGFPGPVRFEKQELIKSPQVLSPVSLSRNCAISGQGELTCWLINGTESKPPKDYKFSKTAKVFSGWAGHCVLDQNDFRCWSASLNEISRWQEIPNLDFTAIKSIAIGNTTFCVAERNGISCFEKAGVITRAKNLDRIPEKIAFDERSFSNREDLLYMIDQTGGSYVYHRNLGVWGEWDENNKPTITEACEFVGKTDIKCITKVAASYDRVSEKITHGLDASLKKALGF